jgi:WD40 repeat protein
MKQHLLALLLLLTPTLPLILSLEHDKSFLFQDGSTSVYCVALYRNSLLYTSTSDIVQKDIDSGAFQRTFRAHTGRVMDLIVTNSSTMFSAGIDDMIVMWDLETGAIIKRFRMGASGTLVQSISLQGDHIFAGGIDFKFRQVNLVTGRVMRTFGML